VKRAAWRKWAGKAVGRAWKGRKRGEGGEAVGQAAKGGKKEKKEEKKVAGPKGEKEGDKNAIQMFSLNLNPKI
jgi:hypothetical protein